MNYQLAKGEVLTLLGSEGIEAVTVQSGRVWLTKPGEDRDYCLAPGERLPCRGAKMLVIEALEDTTLSLSALPAVAPRRLRIVLAVSCQLHG